MFMDFEWKQLYGKRHTNKTPRKNCRIRTEMKKKWRKMFIFAVYVAIWCILYLISHDSWRYGKRMKNVCKWNRCCFQCNGSFVRKQQAMPIIMKWYELIPHRIESYFGCLLLIFFCIQWTFKIITKIQILCMKLIETETWLGVCVCIE